MPGVSNMLRARQILQRLGCDRHGAVAAEFALISPLLFTMIVGIIEYSFIMFSFSAMQFGATTVAREMSVNSFKGSTPTEAVKSYLPGWLKDQVTVTVAQSTPADPRTNIFTVKVSAPALNATPMSVFTRSVPWTLSAEASMSQELPFEE